MIPLWSGSGGGDQCSRAYVAPCSASCKLIGALDGAGKKRKLHLYGMMHCTSAHDIMHDIV